MTTMKKIRQWILARRDQRLRKWCVEQAIKMTSKVICGSSLQVEAQTIYDWITSEPRK